LKIGFVAFKEINHLRKEIQNILFYFLNNKQIDTIIQKRTI